MSWICSGASPSDCHTKLSKSEVFWRAFYTGIPHSTLVKGQEERLKEKGRKVMLFTQRPFNSQCFEGFQWAVLNVPSARPASAFKQHGAKHDLWPLCIYVHRPTSPHPLSKALFIKQLKELSVSICESFYLNRNTHVHYKHTQGTDLHTYCIHSFTEQIYISAYAPTHRKHNTNVGVTLCIQLLMKQW